MLEVTLGFPPSDLSPNKRLHWAKLAKAKKRYREACWGITLEQLQQQTWSLPDGDLVLEMLFVCPDRRTYDRDNLTARMKSGLDGMCDAIKIDDKRFATVIVKVAPEIIGGFVKIKVYGENDGKESL